MKKLILIISLVFLCGCKDDPNFVKNISGEYIEGLGSIDGLEINSLSVVDKGQSINVVFKTPLEDITCKYVFLEKLDSVLYFVTIPEGLLNILSFEVLEKTIELKTLGVLDLMEMDRCKKVEIINAFIGVN